MANEQNLLTGEGRNLTTEEAREIGRKGGIASGEARRRRRTLREAAQVLLSAKLAKGVDADAELLKELGIDDPTNADGLMLIALLKAARGDVEAMRFVRDTGGESPTNKVEIGGMDDKPLEVLDLSGLSDDQLRELAARRMEQSAENG